MKNKDLTFMVAGAVLILVVMATFFVYAGDYIGFDAGSAGVFIALLPGLMVLVVSAVTIPKRGLFAVAGFSGLGIGFAILVRQMHEQGIVSEAMLTGLTIGQEQMLIVGVLTAIGIVTMVLSK